MKRLISVLVAPLAVLTAIPLAGPASAAPATTTITMNVSGCEGCTIIPLTNTAATADEASSGSGGYNGPKTRVTNGVATIVVPTSETEGMSFAVQPTWKSYTGAQPLIAFRYKGAPIAGTLSRAETITYKKASSCWAGTAGIAATINVRTSRVWLPSDGYQGAGKRTQAVLAWVVPTQDALLVYNGSKAGYWPVYKGSLAGQDYPVCHVN